jgi:hypothetical protein
MMKQFVTQCDNTFKHIPAPKMQQAANGRLLKDCTTVICTSSLWLRRGLISMPARMADANFGSVLYLVHGCIYFFRRIGSVRLEEVLQINQPTRSTLR